ncbi:hypothetical protein KNE206_57790 [Kitasatospora sp. NE20-6]|uniref:hypothetical protein n=1 Tax=Kitasatospora sp. NE20-6 TaxID=2859066 RepID=UPI0034DBAA38
MAFEERRAWITAVVTVCSYGLYLAVVLGRADGVPLATVPYAAALLWSIAGAVAASVALTAAAALVSPEGAGQKDLRDREINRFGEYAGRSFLVVGGVTVLVLAMTRADHFWIANATYLAFALSALLGSAARISAHRWGFSGW